MPEPSKLKGERAFYTLDRDLRLLGASENTLALWGKSRGDIRGKSLFDLFPSAESGPTHQAIDEALRTFRPVRIKIMSVYLGGEIDLEIYPVSEGVQVSFALSRTSSGKVSQTSHAVDRLKPASGSGSPSG